jgi:ribosomal protein L15
LISSATNPVKVLSSGELKLKNLKFEGIRASAEAKKKIEAASGTMKK